MIEVVNYREDFENTTILDQLSVFLDEVLYDFEAEGEAVNLVICDDKLIQELNSSYRGKDAPTDVLSFSQEEGEEIDTGEAESDEAAFALGDIVISLDRARLQAVEYGVTLEEELARLAIHGCLHLLGFDHETNEQDAAEMFAEQDAYLDQFLKEYYPDRA